MTSQTHYLSQDAFDKLKIELDELKSTKLHAIAKRIDEARQMGDLSENAEYHAARDEMAWAQTRVKEIERILDGAEIITEGGNSDEVVIGSHITVSVRDREREYTIVGATEADPLSGKISNESPLGQAFLGKKKGDVVQVEVPAGLQEYKILDIE